MHVHENHGEPSTMIQQLRADTIQCPWARAISWHLQHAAADAESADANNSFDAFPVDTNTDTDSDAANTIDVPTADTNTGDTVGDSIAHSDTD